MKKILLISIAVAAIACTSGEKKECNQNALQSENVSCQYLVYTKDTTNPEWMNGLDAQNFFTNVFTKVFDNQIKVYNPVKFIVNPTVLVDTDSAYFDTASMAKDIKWNEIKNISPQIKSILFAEKWNFDKNTNRFTKKVNYWSPIRTFYHDNNINWPVMKMIFIANSGKETEKKLIASNIYYQTSLVKSTSPNEYFNTVGFDPYIFISYLFKMIDNGQIKAVDPVFIVDQTKKYFSKEELEKYIGIKLNEKEIDNSFLTGEYSFIFNEDWYFDDSDFSFSKNVKGLGLVRMGYEDTPISKAFKKKILFFVLFDN
jgi:hypothetical protein